MTTSSRPDLVNAVAAWLVFAVVLWARAVLNDGDTWWHVEAGRVMLAQHAVLHTDPFSATFRGQPWPTHEWLSEVIFAGAHEVAGWSGVVLLTALAVGLAAWMLANEIGRRLSGLPHLCLLLLAFSLFAPHLLVRPHILALPVMVAWAAELLRARDEDRAPRWAFLPLMALWANLHGGFMFGLALIGPFALEALVAAPPGRRAAVALRWAGFGLAALAIALATPHGLAGVLFPFKLSGMWANSQIGEWRAADFSRLTPLAVCLLAGLFVALTRPVRLEPLRAALLVGLVYASLVHNRHEQLLAVVGGLMLAAPLARAFGRSGAPAAPPPRTGRLLAAGAAVAVLTLGVARLSTPLVLTDNVSAPVSALAAVPGDVRARPVLNDYGFGGYLIGHRVAPYVDSRAELYGDGFLKDYGRLIEARPADLDRVLTERRIGWTILKPHTPLALAMDARPGWRRLYADRWAVVHVAEP